MHIAVTWDISDGPDREKISQQMIAVLASYSWVRPLTTFYVIKTDVYGRQKIFDDLLKIGQIYSSRVRFLVSPLMQGTYLGFLNQDLWAPMNERTS